MSIAVYLKVENLSFSLMSFYHYLLANCQSKSYAFVDRLGGIKKVYSKEISNQDRIRVAEPQRCGGSATKTFLGILIFAIKRKKYFW
ncbi:MAG: hypothetical protein HC916_07755 [Coleofasciculaceae cyanobacterium SM2_1_6]|nr:hypothetical protein [Coleofasciculaceae cyanobacterium SM2_1_6]